MRSLDVILQRRKPAGARAPVALDPSAPAPVALEAIGPEGLTVDAPLAARWLQAQLGGDPVFRANADGHLRLRLVRAGDAVAADGEVVAALDAHCIRCLTPSLQALALPVHLTLVPAPAAPEAQADGSLSPEDVGVAAYDGESIDVAALVRDELLLALPLRPLCRPQCAGLCDRCGADRNAGPCSCTPPVDLRWEALRAVKLD